MIGGAAGAAGSFRYWAFISYSHKDEAWAAWLHRKLEGYSGHARLIGTENLRGEALPRRLFPVFRDRDELAGAADLSERIQEALRESRYLIVICSPSAASSRWVNEEIAAFKRLGGEDATVTLWNAGTRQQVGEPLAGPQQSVKAVAFGPDGRTLASGSADGVVMLWDVSGHRPLGPPLTGHDGRVEGLAFSRDGRMLAVVASGTRQSSVSLWNVERRERMELLRGQRIDPARLEFSPGGELLAAGSRSGELFLWDTASRQALGAPLAGHHKPIAALAFSAGGDTLVSADEGGMAILWDVVRRSPMGSLNLGHAQGIRGAVLANDARVMISSSLWGSELMVTDWDAASWADYACWAANRALTRDEWEQFIGAGTEYAPACPQRAPQDG